MWFGTKCCIDFERRHHSFSKCVHNIYTCVYNRRHSGFGDTVQSTEMYVRKWCVPEAVILSSVAGLRVGNGDRKVLTEQRPEGTESHTHIWRDCA